MHQALGAPTLVGVRVRLEPLAPHHASELATAAAHDRATYGLTEVPDGGAAAESYVGKRLAAAEAGEVVPFAQVSTVDDRAVGATMFLGLRLRPGDARPYAVEIGGTWLAASVQRTGFNVEAKLLLLQHAFDTWRVGRVDLKTDARNERSRTAITAFGARFEGVLRCWQPSQAHGEDQLLRDTAMYSIVASEWPGVEALLRHRLDRH